jgi:hypothetical protein
VRQENEEEQINFYYAMDNKLIDSYYSKVDSFSSDERDILI